MADSIEPSKAQNAQARGHQRLHWWRKARFGAFVHWGLYSLDDCWTDRPARTDNWTQEWVMHVRRIPVAEYAARASQFHARCFDADRWVRTFRQAGQRYLIVTAKHHDGFCLFQSKLTDYNTVDATPFARDAIAELADACRRHNMPLGVYYSQTQDWHHPDGEGNDWDYEPSRKDFRRYLQTYVKPQVRELLTNYGPIAVMWFDTPGILTAEQSSDLVKFVHDLQPDCLVNGRVGNGMGDYASTRDNQYLNGAVETDWECPATMNDTWGYRRSDHSWKSVDELLANLRDVNAKGGNYLLNVGPDGEGRIPPAAAERLEEIGRRLSDGNAGN
ncbi:MAG: alpha-L-fucosidase [Phycisphaerae bacterium]